MWAMSEPHERLKEARERAGYRTAKEATERFGWKEYTYRSHERPLEKTGRGFSVEQAIEYGRAFKVSPSWLLTGEDAGSSNTVNVVGFVGAGAEIYPIDDHAMGAGLAEVEAPPERTKDTVAVTVRGDSMWPAYRDGDVLYYNERREDLDALLMRECVVHLRDGRVFVKTLTPGSRPGFYTLTSYNAPPIPDCEIEWAARISWIRRA